MGTFKFRFVTLSVGKEAICVEALPACSGERLDSLPRFVSPTSAYTTTRPQNRLSGLCERLQGKSSGLRG